MNQEWIPQDLELPAFGACRAMGERGCGAQQHSLREVHSQIREGHIFLCPHGRDFYFGG